MKKIVVCWKWKSVKEYRSTFTGQQVNILKNMVKRNTTYDIDFVCITDDPTGIDSDVRIIPLWDNPKPQYGGMTKPNCFVRIKAFSEEMADIIGERFVWMDLDTVVVGNIDHILDDTNDFKIWRPDHERMPCNGSLVSMKTGSRKHVWTRFNPNTIDNETAYKKDTGFVGSDQAWIAQNLTPQDRFFGIKDGVYSFRSHILPKGGIVLDRNTKLVFFNGNEKPWTPQYKDLPWIRDNYQ